MLQKGVDKVPGGGIIALQQRGAVDGSPKLKTKLYWRKTKMKKIFALALAAVMTAGMTTVAFAAD